MSLQTVLILLQFKDFFMKKNPSGRFPCLEQVMLNWVDLVPLVLCGGVQASCRWWKWVCWVWRGCACLCVWMFQGALAHSLALPCWWVKRHWQGQREKTQILPPVEHHPHRTLLTGRRATPNTTAPTPHTSTATAKPAQLAAKMLTNTKHQLIHNYSDNNKYIFIDSFKFISITSWQLG